MQQNYVSVRYTAQVVFKRKSYFCVHKEEIKSHRKPKKKKGKSFDYIQEYELIQE